MPESDATCDSFGEWAEDRESAPSLPRRLELKVEACAGAVLLSCDCSSRRSSPSSILPSGEGGAKDEVDRPDAEGVDANVRSSKALPSEETAELLEVVRSRSRRLSIGGGGNSCCSLAY